LLINAYRHCPPQRRELKITYEPVDPGGGQFLDSNSCIVVANVTLERKFQRLRLQPGEWTTWRIDRDGPQGGLRLIANQLHLTSAGELLARPSQLNDFWWFAVAVRLYGLQLRDVPD